VSDVHNSHGVTDDSIEDFEWIANERYESHAGPPLDARRSFWIIGNVCHNVSDARFERGGDSIAKLLAAITGNLTQVTNGTVRELDLH
jgi:hypothetical protein